MDDVTKAKEPVEETGNTGDACDVSVVHSTSIEQYKASVVTVSVHFSYAFRTLPYAPDTNDQFLTREQP